MADQIQPVFERALEADIERLSAEVKTNREHPEMHGASTHEVIKQSLKTVSPQQQASDAQSGQVPVQNVFQNPLPDYAANAPAETKLEIEHLLETAFREGIMSANAKASNSSPFVLDAFHDALAGKLYPELKKRGIVE
ncbi:MAG: hypothetical protein RL681_295 [Candidatus Parcubacteria bacterium]|jgi:type II secretory pathway component PulM